MPTDKNPMSQMTRGKRISPSSFIQQNTGLAAAISKLVRPKDDSRFHTKLRDQYRQLNQGELNQLVESNQFRIRDIKNMLQLFPDIKLAISIIVSSILSPKDMVNSDLIYGTKADTLPQELTAKLIEIVKEEIENNYDLVQNLYKIVEQAKFTVGSYMDVVIPEAAVDDIINKRSRIGAEALSVFFDSGTNNAKQLGFLGNPTKNGERLGLEQFSSYYRPVPYDPSVTVTETINGAQIKVDLKLQVEDNYQLLKLPLALEAHRSSMVEAMTRPIDQMEITTFANEEQSVSLHDFSNIVYKATPSEMDEFVRVPTKETASRKSVGRPLTMHIPSEAVITVHVPGDETKHIGYFIILDEIDGYPVTMKNNKKYTDQVQSRNFANQQGTSSGLSGLLVQRAHHNLTSNDRNNLTVDQLSKMYTGLVEEDLINRMRNGMYNTDVALSKNEELYRIMMARSLCNRYTRILYIPKELATYVCFDYFDNGIGKSALDDIKMLTSMRAVLLFSKTLGSTKNSIPVTNVKVHLDPEEPDPEEAMEIAMHEVLKMRQAAFPLGLNSGPDMVNWVHRAGIQFSFDGHPGLPETTFEFENTRMDHQLPDETFAEDLRKQCYMALDLSPETVDNGFNSEFATTVAANNLLFSKRIIQEQSILAPHLSDMFRKRIKHDSVIYRRLKETIMESEGVIANSYTDEDEKAEFIANKNKVMIGMLETFIDQFTVTIPPPDVVTLRSKTEAFKDHMEALDEALKAWADQAFMSDTSVGNLSSMVDIVTGMARAYFARKWMTENGYMTELSEILDDKENEEGENLFFRENEMHLKRLMRQMVHFVSNMRPVINASNTDLEKLNSDLEGGGSDYSSDEDSGNGADDGTGGDFDLGGDDLGADTDTGETGAEEPEASEEPAPEETPEPTKAPKDGTGE